jgi:oligoribonuclease NrnB/cAMP/cGMP phosphodiesterase (DHH superfamily)
MTTVLYHADADGFGAAYALWTKLGDEATYIPVQYGQILPEISEDTDTLFIVDFSYDRATCETLNERYKVIILDHHKTAKAALEGLPYAIFDETKSGAVMAWEYIYPGDTYAPTILQYVQDYDLWRFELPESKEVNLYISSLPWDFMAWEQFKLETAIAAGRAIMSFRDQQIKSALKSVRMMDIGVCEGLTYEVPCVNASTNISELGNMLCCEYPEAPFSVSYCDRKNERSWSLRSIGAFDVSDIAKAFGGGGHRNAAGFTTALDWPMEHSSAFLKAFSDEDDHDADLEDML